MQNKKYNLAVFIGRFQPFHLGHLHAIERALTVADRVLVLIGSANTPKTIKNPFSAIDRYQMIHGACNVKGDCEKPLVDNMIFGTLGDHPYDEDSWLKEVQTSVEQHRKPDETVCIVGYEKDDSSYYLKVFPQYAYEDLGYYSIEDSRCMDATRVRELLFTEEFAFLQGVLPVSVFRFLMNWRHTVEFKELQKEYDFVQKYRKQWEGTPYPVNFVAADAVVVQSGHVLLVERGAAPGKGMLAIPGGYVDIKERIFDAAVRELYEETKIGMAESTLRRCLVAERTYDDPGRGLHGRVITTAYLFKLEDTKQLPKVKGSDDAASARWVPLASLTPEGLYSDHYHIIQDLLGRATKA